MMVSPTLGVLAVTATLRRGRPVVGPTGLRTAGGFRTWWRWALLAWLAPLPLSASALAPGVYRPDLRDLSGFVEILRARDALPISPWTLVIAQLVQVLVVGWLDVLPALGEEWGWRGRLLPELLPLGRWPAIYYPLHSGPVRLLLMVGFCVVLSALLGWLRLRSGSVWPAAIGHGFLNAAAGLPILFSTAGQPVDNATTGLLGWTGWIVLALALLSVAAWTHRRTPTS